MVTRMNPKATVSKSMGKGHANPSGKPAQRDAKKIESPASKAKDQGGSAHLGAGIGNTT